MDSSSSSVVVRGTSGLVVVIVVGWLVKDGSSSVMLLMTLFTTDSSKKLCPKRRGRLLAMPDWSLRSPRRDGDVPRRSHVVDSDQADNTRVDRNIQLQSGHCGGDRDQASQAGLWLWDLRNNWFSSFRLSEL